MDYIRHYLQIAELVARESHCVSVKVGAVFVREHRIVMSACNNTPDPFVKCDELFPCYQQETQREKHHSFSDRFENHAEMNGVLSAARQGVSLRDCDLFVTHQPCSNCLKYLCGLGIHNVFFLNAYDKCGWDKLTMKMIDDCGLHVTHITKA